MFLPSAAKWESRSLIGVQPIRQPEGIQSGSSCRNMVEQSSTYLRQDKDVAKLFDVLGPRYKDRQGGYVRVLKAGFRYGDMAPMAIIEFVDRDPAAKGAADKARTAAEEAGA